MIKNLIYSILAGICISIGGVAFLSINNSVIGALFFCIGLFIILNYKYNLFTGKLCYTFTNNLKYFYNLFITLIGNFIGTNIVGLSLNLTRLVSLKEKCETIVNNKLNDNLLSIFILAIFCNILIYIAVEGFKSDNSLTKYLSLFFGVATFVICGFEHCVADMFYFSFALSYSFKTFLCLFVVILGNFVGGNILELIKLLLKDKDTNKKTI